MFRKGQTYNLSDPKAESIYHSDVVGVFRRNESVAIRGKIKAGGVQKLLDDLSENRSDNTNNNDDHRSLSDLLYIVTAVRKYKV